MHIKEEKMENKKVLIGVFVLGICIGMATSVYKCTKKKYSMNLKCVQGELYEEVRDNMFVKSHLECFEQRTY
jgi:hypothetical protein